MNIIKESLSAMNEANKYYPNPITNYKDLEILKSNRIRKDLDINFIKLTDDENRVVSLLPYYTLIKLIPSYSYAESDTDNEEAYIEYYKYRFMVQLSGVSYDAWLMDSTDDEVNILDIRLELISTKSETSILTVLTEVNLSKYDFGAKLDKLETLVEGLSYIIKQAKVMTDDEIRKDLKGLIESKGFKVDQTDSFDVANEAFTSVIANPDISSTDLKPISSKDAAARADELEYDFSPIIINTNEGAKKLQAYYAEINLTEYRVQVYVDGASIPEGYEADEDTDTLDNDINIYFYFYKKSTNSNVMAAWKSPAHLDGNSTDEIIDSLVDKLEEVHRIIKKLKLLNNEVLSEYAYIMKFEDYKVFISRHSSNEALKSYIPNILPDSEYMKTLKGKLSREYYSDLNDIVYTDSEGTHAILPYAGRTDSTESQRAEITISGSDKYDYDSRFLKWMFSISDYFSEYDCKFTFYVDLSNLDLDQVLDQLSEIVEASDHILDEIDLRIKSTKGQVDMYKSYEVVKDAINRIGSKVNVEWGS